MEKKYELVSKIIEELHNSGALHKLVLVGSWCTHYYKNLFEHGDKFIPLLRTMDIDFMIPTPHRINKKVNVHDLLIQMEFRPEFHTLSGLVKYRHPELEIEFLTPEMGRGDKKVYEIKPFGINAVGLRYLNLLQNNIIEVSHSNDIKIYIPSPEAFALHKFMISQLRKNDVKAGKDINMAKAIGELCMNSGVRKENIIRIFSSLPKKWQTKILDSVKDVSDNLHKCLFEYRK
ncbi:MAG: nucleotidyltransferase domain-containing protein [Proteobacteria bacterium]|nr:nucleotidyltransferase domain-containing protein [Pseudomonadota bacterium]